MFKKNLYAFCALLALSYSAYAIEKNEDRFVPSARCLSAFKDSSATLDALDQEPSELKVSASSPASSTQSFSFSQKLNHYLSTLDEARKRERELERQSRALMRNLWLNSWENSIRFERVRDDNMAIYSKFPIIQATTQYIPVPEALSKALKAARIGDAWSVPDTSLPAQTYETSEASNVSAEDKLVRKRLASLPAQTSETLD